MGSTRSRPTHTRNPVAMDLVFRVCVGLDRVEPIDRPGDLGRFFGLLADPVTALLAGAVTALPTGRLTTLLASSITTLLPGRFTTLPPAPAPTLPPRPP